MKIENNIGWCDETTNAVTGCDKVSPGCKNCYAATGTRARVLRSQGIETWGPKGVRHPVAQFAEKIRRLNKLCVCDVCHEAHPIGRLKEKDGTAGGTPAARCGVQRSDEYGFCQGGLRRIRLFADSNSDWLDEKWSIEVLANFLKEIHDAPNVDVLLLTKRPENWRRRLGQANDSMEPGCEVRKWLTQWIGSAALQIPSRPPNNVWLGVSVENQAMADLRIPQLLDIPAAVRFLSCEPLLEKINLACVGEQHDGYNRRGNFYDLACENHCTWAGFESDLIPDPEQSDEHADRNGTNYVCPKCHCESGLVEIPDDAIPINWVIVGGESGADRRDCGVGAIVSVAEQCAAAGVPVYVKQDCAFKSGEQGRIPQEVWKLKQFPGVLTAENAKGAEN